MSAFALFTKGFAQVAQRYRHHRREILWFNLASEVARNLGK